MLADKRKVWGSALIIFLFCSIIIFHILDNGVLCGVMVKSEEKLMQRCSDKLFVEHFLHAEDLLLFNNQPIPYDEEANCFYICQNIRNKDYSGTITSASENTDIWFVKDEYVHDLKNAVGTGHSFCIWIANKDSYTKCNLIFTGLPVISMHTEEADGTEYLFGDIIVWNPNDKEIGAVSCKDSRMQLKCSESMETYTAKLMDREDVNRRKLSLLDMGKYDAWKFYAVSPKDNTYIRSMLSYLMWNRVNTIEGLDRPCQYAEMIVNNEYKGLFLAAPRVDDDYIELGEAGEVISVELQDNEQKIPPPDENSGDDTIYHAKDAYAVETLRSDQLAEYFLFLEATYAYQNISDQFYVIWDSANEQSFLMPGKIEYSFGLFPNRLQYMTWQAQERVLTPQLLEIEGVFTDEDVKQQMGQRWQTLRSVEFSNDELIRMIDELDLYLSESGYVARCGLAGGNAYAHAESIGELKNYLTARTEVLDRYYGTGAIPDDAVAGSTPDALLQDGASEDTAGADLYSYTGYTDIALQMDNGTVTQNIKMYMKGDQCYFFLPACASSYEFTIQYPEDHYAINIDDKPVASGEQITYHKLAGAQTLAVATDGDHVPYSIEFMQSENLPAIFIETANGTMEYVNTAKTNKEAGDMICVLPDGSVDSMGAFSIHARGSASFEFAQQKQYKIELEDPTDILSMGKGCAWVLQANALDSTKIRNNIAYGFAKNLGLRYAVDSAYADVYFNGEYGGNYLVCEPVELGANRISVNEETSYLLAIDRVSPGDDSFTDQYEQTFDIRYPKENTPEEVEWLRTRINKIETLTDSCSTLTEYQELQTYIDTDSFVNMYLMNAITNETDANGASFYFYIDGDDGKLYAGPAWDYDRAWGNSKRRGSYQFNVYQNGIAERLALIPYFEQDIQEKLQSSEDALMQLKKDVKTVSHKIRASVNMEDVIYGGIDWGFLEIGDYDTDIAFLEYYMENRIDWISDIILHPDIYHRVFVRTDHAEVTYWVKDGETIPADDLAYIYESHYCDSLLFENGGAFWSGCPILEDTVLYGHKTEESVSETEAANGGENAGKSATATLESDKEIQGMGILAFIIILAPGFIVLLISMDRNKENIGKADLLIRYFCYDFVILLFTYGSIYLVKGAITLSLSGAVDEGFDYTIYNVNVVFLLMILELIGACALGCGIRVCRKAAWKRTGKG